MVKITGTFVQLAFFLFTIFFLSSLYLRYIKTRHILVDLLTVISTALFLSGLINIILTGSNRRKEKVLEKKQLFIKHNNQNYIKIYELYLKYPDKLASLFYEFFGTSGFPRNVENNNKINQYEYIVINIIIEDLVTMFIIDNNIFEDLNFQNRINNFARSKKFKYVLSYNKGNYPPSFIKKIIDENIIHPRDLQIENIDIIKM